MICLDYRRALLIDIQGGQIMDNAFCGGGDLTTPLSSWARSMIKAAIFMGNPSHIPGLSYNVGTCTASGVRLMPHQTAA